MKDKSNKNFTLITIGLMLLTLLATQQIQAGDVLTGWSFDESMPNNFKKHGYKIVKAADGHPVRDGKKSVRFELRHGDCGWSPGWSDCENDRQRHELTSKSDWGSVEHWYHWSIFIPESYPVIYPVKVALAQFHQRRAGPVLMFQNHDGGYFVNQQDGKYDNVSDIKILDDGEMRGKWTDVLAHIRWTHKKEGFIRIYVNGNTTPSYKRSGQTKLKGKRVYFKFGIYHTYVSRWDGDTPTQVVYYDAVKKARSCRKATDFFDCEKILQSN